MLRIKRRKHPKMGTIREDAPIRSPSHLKWVRGFGCCIEGRKFPISGFDGKPLCDGMHSCEGKIEAMHVRTGTGAGVGIKPGDDYTIPGCAKAHRLQHQVGEAEFERRYGIDMKAIAKDLAQRSPHLRKLRA